MRGSGPGKIEQIGNDIQGGVDLLLNDFQVFLHSFVGIRKNHLQEVDGIAHHPEGIAQFVSHAPRELAEDGELLPAHQFFLDLKELPRSLLDLRLQFSVPLL